MVEINYQTDYLELISYKSVKKKSQFNFNFNFQFQFNLSTTLQRHKRYMSYFHFCSELIQLSTYILTQTLAQS